MTLHKSTCTFSDCEYNEYTQFKTIDISVVVSARNNFFTCWA